MPVAQRSNLASNFNEAIESTRMHAYACSLFLSRRTTVANLSAKHSLIGTCSWVDRYLSSKQGESGY